MAPKLARSVVAREVTSTAHPFVTFPEVQAYQERSQRLVCWCIHAGCTLDWVVVQTLGVEDEIRCLLHTPPYSKIFIIAEPTYVELVCEFYTSFTYQCEWVSFSIGGVNREMNIEEFGIALGVWQREELETPAYQTAVRDFPEDVLIYWPRSALLEPHTRVASPKSHVFFLLSATYMV